MKKLKQITGSILLRVIRMIPPRTAIAGFLIGMAALLTTTTTSCGPRVSCYEPAINPSDTIQQDSVAGEESKTTDTLQQNQGSQNK